MNRLLAGFWLLAASPAALSQAQVSGDQTGTWTLAGSPYELVGDVTVPAGDSLSVEAGVEVIGMGHYSITVLAGATLTAAGAEGRPILFTAADHDEGWRGMKLMGSSDATVISRCVFEYAKADGLPYPDVRGGALSIIGCSPEVSHSEFRHSLSRNANQNGVGGGILTESSNAVIHSNYVHDNVADSGVHLRGRGAALRGGLQRGRRRGHAGRGRVPERVGFRRGLGGLQRGRRDRLARRDRVPQRVGGGLLSRRLGQGRRSRPSIGRY